MIYTFICGITFFFFSGVRFNNNNKTSASSLSRWAQEIILGVSLSFITIPVYQPYIYTVVNNKRKVVGK